MTNMCTFPEEKVSRRRAHFNCDLLVLFSPFWDAACLKLLLLLGSVEYTHGAIIDMVSLEYGTFPVLFPLLFSISVTLTAFFYFQECFWHWFES